MRFFIILTAAIAMTLAGCSKPASEPITPVSDALLLPKTGMAKVIVYYPYSKLWLDSYLSSDKRVDVVIAADERCRLKSGNFFARDIAPGKTVVAASLCSGNGVTKFPIQIEANKTYYLQVMPFDHSILGLIAARGTKVNEDPTPRPGETPDPYKSTHVEGTAFSIDLMDEQYGKVQLTKLKMIP